LDELTYQKKKTGFRKCQARGLEDNRSMKEKLIDGGAGLEERRSGQGRSYQKEKGNSGKGEKLF